MAEQFVVTCSRGMEDLLVGELRRIGLQRVHEEIGSVRFSGKIKDGLRACLWSRVGSRVLMRVGRFQGATADDLYDGIKAIEWERFIRPTDSLWVTFTGSSKILRHSQFSARQTKDGIVDRFRERVGERPSVDKELGHQVHVLLRHNVFTVSLDLCGPPLHLRTPNRHITEAPLKENLAGALLLHAGWHKALKRGTAFADPLCGSGTIALEALGMACNKAANIDRQDRAFTRWIDAPTEIWQQLTEEAQALQCPVRAPIFCSDIDAAAVAAARHNLRKQGFAVKDITIRNQPLTHLQLPSETGLLVSNPPYGERIGAHAHVDRCYSDLGDALRRHPDWRAFLLCPPNELYQHTGYERKEERRTLYNGPLRCRLLELDTVAEV